MFAVLLIVAALIVTTISVVFWMSKAPQIEEQEETREKIETKASAFAAQGAEALTLRALHALA
jgi:Tfp pilus assembly protein PilO